MEVKLILKELYQATDPYVKEMREIESRTTIQEDDGARIQYLKGIIEAIRKPYMLLLSEAMYEPPKGIRIDYESLNES